MKEAQAWGQAQNTHHYQPATVHMHPCVQVTARAERPTLRELVELARERGAEGGRRALPPAGALPVLPSVLLGSSGTRLWLVLGGQSSASIRNAKLLRQDADFTAGIQSMREPSGRHDERTPRSASPHSFAAASMKDADNPGGAMEAGPLPFSSSTPSRHCWQGCLTGSCCQVPTAREAQYTFAGELQLCL